MRTGSSAGPEPEPKRGAGELALVMYGAWLGAMLAVYIWAEHRRRRDLERALAVLAARRPVVPDHLHDMRDIRQRPDLWKPAPPVDGDGAAVITLPLPQSERDIHDD